VEKENHTRTFIICNLQQILVYYDGKAKDVQMSRHVAEMEGENCMTILI
jgi:hypothetical protein